MVAQGSIEVAVGRAVLDYALAKVAPPESVGGGSPGGALSHIVGNYAQTPPTLYVSRYVQLLALGRGALRMHNAPPLCTGGEMTLLSTPQPSSLYTLSSHLAHTPPPQGQGNQSEIHILCEVP